VKSPLGTLRADWAFTDAGNNRLQFTIGEKF
jgi:outer membrane protein assembly factor BamA